MTPLLVTQKAINKEPGTVEKIRISKGITWI
jgi:hypothetical protein